MAKAMAPPPAPHTRHITKRSPVKAKTYSTSRIFKKTQQKPAEVHGKKNAIWADKQGNVWLRKLVQKQKDEKKKAKEIHPLAKEFNETIDNTRTSILETSLSSLNIASEGLQDHLTRSTQAFEASIVPMREFFEKQLMLPLGESKIYYLMESQAKAANNDTDGGVHDAEGDKGKSQIFKQHSTTLSASMDKFRKKLAAQRKIINDLKKEWDTAQAEILAFKSSFGKESEEEEKLLRADIDEHVKGWRKEMKVAGDQARKRCEEGEKAFEKGYRNASQLLYTSMDGDDD